MNAPLYILINLRDIAIEPTYWHVLFMKLKQLKCKKGCFSYTYTRKLYKYMSLHIRIYYFFVIKKKQPPPPKKKKNHKHTHTQHRIYILKLINCILFWTFKRRCNFLTLLRIRSKFCIGKIAVFFSLSSRCFTTKFHPPQAVTSHLCPQSLISGVHIPLLRTPNQVNPTVYNTPQVKVTWLTVRSETFLFKTWIDLSITLYSSFII